MTLYEVRKRLKEIKEVAEYDSEGAHGRVDSLWKDILSDIASGRPTAAEAAKLATAALKTENIGFGRWCA